MLKEMEEQASGVTPVREKLEHLKSSPKGVQEDQITPVPIEDIISELPPGIVESRKRNHAEVFSHCASPSPALSTSIPHPISASTSTSTSTTPSPSSSSPPSLPQPRPKRWMKWLFKILRSSWTPTSMRRKKKETLGETFLRTIELEVSSQRGKSIYTGVAMIDIWTPFNVMSRAFANEIFDDLDSYTPYQVFDTLGGAAYAIKSTDARWHFPWKETIKSPLIRFHCKMERSKFQIMEHDGPFDIIIGLEDILRLDLLNQCAKSPLVAPHFRSQKPPVNDRTVIQDEAAARSRREAAQRERTRDDHKRRIEAWALTVAQQRATEHAYTQSNDIRSDVWQRAYHQELPRQLEEAMAYYTQNHSQT